MAAQDSCGPDSAFYTRVLIRMQAPDHDLRGKIFKSMSAPQKRLRMLKCNISRASSSLKMTRLQPCIVVSLTILLKCSSEEAFVPHEMTRGIILSD